MLIERLKVLQSEHGFLPRERLVELSRSESIPLYQIESVASFYPHFRTTPPPAVEIAVCADMSCWLRGAAALEDGVRRELAAAGIVAVPAARTGPDGSGAAADGSGATRSGSDGDGPPPAVVLHPVSCLGLCDRAPACAVNDRPFGDASPASVAARVRDALAAAPSGGNGHGVTPPSADGTPARPRASTGTAPSRIDPYEGGERYGALRRLLAGGDPATVVAALKESGLRGLGGAGFPTGTKWELTRKVEARPKYVVCNADESEPGTFKDREVLERFPHLVLEGMLIGAWVVGAERATLFLRHEYQDAGDRVREAIAEIAALGLAGENVLGSGFSCELELFVSAGGYICGEETALLEAMEGKRAEPRNKPPFPGVAGLHALPTLMNNVETFAMVPGILTRSPQWFRGLGENGGSGLKLFALSGHVNRPGVYESWLGIPARRFIDQFGGGMQDGRALKAFAPGGASSGFLPARMADLPLDFKPLAEAGSMLGTGAVVAIAEGTCMLALALNVVRFFRNESCGKCVPCREGTEELVTILERMRDGRGRPDDLEVIDELADTMAMSSICGLGQAAPLPVTSVIRHWRDEVEAHLQGRCPEGTCR